MADNENFEDPSSFIHLLLALIAALALPLLPMLMGWYTFFS